MTIITDAGGLVVSSSAAELGGDDAVSDATGATVRQPPSTAVAAPDKTSAPPKADAAVRASAGETFAGLAALLNKTQQELSTGTNAEQDFPDEYEIVFTPESLKNATLAKSGTTAYNAVAMEDKTKAKSLDPDTNSTNMKSRTCTIAAGTQIIQVINDVFKNSSYIVDQQIKTTDEVTQETKSNDTLTQQNVSWFKINTVATPTDKFDKKRNDFAYKITYNISKFDINAMLSPYFPGAKYRGAQKAYQYWFTGENTAVLDFSIDYNSTYSTYTVVGKKENGVSGLRAQQEDYTKRIYGDQFFQPTVSPQSTSGSNAQGAKGKANEGPASAEDYLFDPGALATIKVKIVGDPAYLQQGCEITSSRPPTYAPFLPDGTINFNTAEIVFTMAWNNPADYNLETGLIDINQVGKNPDGTPKNLPQYAQAYKATEITSTFSRGKFEQELTGILLGSLKQLTAPNGVTASGRESVTAQNGARISNNSVDRIRAGGSTEQTEPPQAATNGDVGSAEIRNVVPTALPQPPTSDGEIFDETGLRSNIRRNTETGELFDATGLRTNPQLMNREY
jgi:hypothetical protein